MWIHEYQAKALLQKFGIAIPPGILSQNVQDAVSAAKTFGGSGKWAIKAQIHAGGRFKAGGVKLATSLDEVASFSENLFNKTIITEQSAGYECTVREILVEQALTGSFQFYVAFAFDRDLARNVVMVCAEGADAFDDIITQKPENILTTVIDPVCGMASYVTRKLAYNLGLRESEDIASFEKLLQKLYSMYLSLDCELLEINPIIKETTSGEWTALDAKCRFDDSALFRHPDLKELQDNQNESLPETLAREIGLSYVKLGGDVGCLVNGAGLSLATVDLIVQHGGRPANFLDVGGGASLEMIEKAFDILLQDSTVKVLLVNIFGGIMRCDLIAQALQHIANKYAITIPIVLRFEGTNVSLAKKILSDSNLHFFSTNSMEEAVRKAVEFTKGKGDKT